MAGLDAGSWEKRREQFLWWTVMAHVLVIGASRGVGAAAVEAALAAGHSVRAMARSFDEPTTAPSTLERLTGDARDQVTVADALRGIDVVIQCLGIPVRPDTILGPVTLFSDATRVLVAAMQAAGTRRLISVTGAGTDDSRDRGPCLVNMGVNMVLGAVYDDKERQERIIRRSGLDWVIARPVVLTGGPATGAYQVTLDQANWRPSLITRADVADFLVKQVDDDAYLGRTPILLT